MEIVVSIFAVLVGLGCFYAIYRSDKKDNSKGRKVRKRLTLRARAGIRTHLAGEHYAHTSVPGRSTITTLFTALCCALLLHKSTGVGR